MGYYWIVTSRSIVRLFGRFVSLGDKAMALTFYPFIFMRPDTRSHESLLQHEQIHIKQQLELLIIGAWMLYGIEYFYARYIKKLDKRQAYYYTALEQEAHRNSKVPNYLKQRKSYAVLRYVFDKKHLSRGEFGELIEKDYA